MIEKMFPQTVSNILDYDVIKEAAKKYVEDVFVEIVQSFGDNLVIQSMDKEHLEEVSYNVAGNKNLTAEELIDYINSENTYRECDFFDELVKKFPEGVGYKEFEVTGWGFPESDVFPFNKKERSYDFDGEPSSGGQDSVWFWNSDAGNYEHNLIQSRFRKDYSGSFDGKRVSGRRASWGNSATWMTTGGFGKPQTIHINVDESRTVIEGNGLSVVENWLGTVANKLPISLYIEISDVFVAEDPNDGVGMSGSTEGYKSSFTYAEEEIFCVDGD